MIVAHPIYSVQPKTRGEMSNRTESYAKPGMQSEQEIGKLTFFSILREGKVCQLNYRLFSAAFLYGTARV